MLKTQKDEYQQIIGLRFNQGEKKVTAFLTNFKTRTYIDVQESQQRMALLCYFQDQFGFVFKAYYAFNPYFYVGFENKMESQVRLYIESKVPKILNMQTVQKIDLQQINHLSGRMKKYLKISFRTIGDLTNARKFLDIRKKKNTGEIELYLDPKKSISDNPKDFINDIRQYDVPYHTRVCIDTGIRAGKWFELQLKDKFIKNLGPSQKKSIPDLKVLAFDIETSKDPFKFPEKEKDVVMMISIMFEGEAVLIINNGFCNQKVQDFDYQPEGKKQFRCSVRVYNMPSEKETLQMFGDIIQNYKPTVITSFNGDRFDYPFIEARCTQNYLDFYKIMGVNNKTGEYFGAYVSHLDCYYWVDRDAYLPQGSRGLKAVTRSKLKYEPIEVDPEKMVQMGKYKTNQLAQYAVSDAVATFYLYMKHIHGFIYALSTIIPMMPDQVLRRGSGTLCENLLMAQAYSRNIIFPNKQMENFQKFYKGHLLQSQTYTGGKVECLRSGIYRSDFPTDFTLSPKCFQSLIESLDQIISFTIKHQTAYSLSQVENLAQVKSTIIQSLSKLRDVPNPSKYQTLPLIYHIDVAAMYPNIIITNRLQPVAIVNDRICSGCLFNTEQNMCKRSLQWEWKGEYFPLNEGQYELIKQKQALKWDPKIYNKIEQQKNLKNEVKKYCQKIYSKSHISVSQIRKDTVCMRENSFYVDTVRAFRDRRYQYKTLTKVHKGKASERAKEGKFEQEKQQIKLMQLFQSMQLAHKIILNSFYGYVMRKGSRWYSMQTAAMVTYIGSNIINDSKNFIEAKLGKPLQLDTDGIWMLLPTGFPQDVKLKFKNNKSYTMSYPCQILNHLIYEKYANPQYQQLKNQENFSYEIRKQMTIAFEIDGPYKAMFIPGGKEKKKTSAKQIDIQQHSTQMLKKRYVVFNHKNEVSEFKGLEMKRRGQLNIIKMFQSQIFGQYVKGSTLKQCYSFCANIAMTFLNFILKKGEGCSLQDVLERLQESKNLSKDVEDYGQSKGVAISAAKRLADYLGPQVVKGKNICLYYIISAYPLKRPVTQRAIPTQIFFAEDPQVKRKFLYKWTKNDDLQNPDIQVDIRNILDWDYYKQRLSTQIQKMICIPAVMQNIPNPIPQIQLPQWLQKKTFDMRYHKQQKISMYGFLPLSQKANQVENKNFSSHKKEIKQDEKKYRIQPKDLFQTSKRSSLRNSKKNVYSMKTNFKPWFDLQKQIWRDYKRQIGFNESLKFNQLKSVLQIVPVDGSPGTFNIWYYSGNRIQSLLIHFKRHYFVKDNKGLKKAPRQQGPAMQIIAEQSQFLKNIDYYDCNFGKNFYQTKIPLLTNLILKKGNLWKISKHLSLYRQQDVHEVFGAEYLPQIQKNFMPIVYLSKICVFQKKHIFFIYSSKTEQYTIIYLQNSLGFKTDDLLNLFRKTVRKQHAKIEIKIKKKLQQAGSFINETLRGIQKRIKQKFLVVLQADCEVSYLKQIGVDCLQQEMPVLKLPQTTIHQQLSLVDWRQKLLIQVLNRSGRTSNKIVSLLDWSRFTHIPICNISQYPSQNLLDYVTNIAYTRLLHANDYVSWWNDYNSQIIQTYESKNQSDKIIHPGLYTSYCVEINIDNLAVNSIVNADQLGFEDRQIGMMIQKSNYGNKSGNHSANTVQHKVQYIDQMAQTKKAFDCLRKMIKMWIQDLNINLEKANDLLRNFHKWLTTYSNSLYDPLLFKFVNQLMKKMFNNLIRKLSNLGLNVIYASFSKLIVSTQKHTYMQAHNMIKYTLQKCAKENEKIFGYLVLEPLDSYYQILLYKDPYNIVGILVNEQFQKKQLELLQCSENQGYQVKNIFYEFQMSSMFNPITRQEFKHLLLQFILKLYNIKKKLVLEYLQKNNKMKLILNYDSLINQKIKEYIADQFSHQIINSIHQIISIWEEEKSKQKQQTLTKVQEQVTDNQEDEQDSFIVNDQDQISEENQENSDLNILDQSSSLMIQQDIRKDREKAIKKKKKADDGNRVQIDFSQWKNDKQLDTLIETLIYLLNHSEDLYDSFSQLRTRCLQEIHSQPAFNYKVIEPIYPQFQLPCSNCFLVNERPGKCQHCDSYINAQNQLQNSIWKMMQQQGRDLYCSRCNDILVGYLKKCRCGGAWELREDKLSWLKYMKREDQVWNYCNKIFQFIGIQ